MTLDEWAALDERRRAELMSSWDFYKPSQEWMTLYTQAAAELRSLYRGDARVVDVIVANHHGVAEVTVLTKSDSPLESIGSTYRTVYKGLPVRQALS